MDAPERPSRLELEKAWHNRLRRAFSQYQRNLECANETVDQWRLVRECGPHPDGVAGDPTGTTEGVFGVGRVYARPTHLPGLGDSQRRSRRGP